MNKNSIAQGILEAINSNMETINKQAEQLEKARRAASETYFRERQINQAKKDHINSAIADLKDALDGMVQNENSAAEKTYNETLVKLGLKSSDHPFKPIVSEADKAAKTVLGVFGNVIKAAEKSFDYLKDGVNATRKS